MRTPLSRRVDVALLASAGVLAIQVAASTLNAQPAASTTGASTPGPAAGQVSSARAPHDPGVRTGAASAGGPLEGLTAMQQEYFLASQAEFAGEEGVKEGLGPRMNLDSCGGCHSYPAVGGASPAINPQVAFATKNGGSDLLPSFLS